MINDDSNISMNIIPHLAHSLGRRDELPNKQLAIKIAETKDRSAVKQVVANLSNPNKNIQADCIKVLDEIAIYAPSLVSNYFDEMIKLLAHKNNRMVWGAMIVINNITNHIPSKVYEAFRN